MRHVTKDPATSTRSRWFVVAAALIPFICAVVAQATGPSPQNSVKQAESTGLVFEQYLIDLGEVPPLPLLEAKFRFTNHGNSPVTIKDLKPSCGCLNPRLKKREYQPGETGEFSVRVQTVGEKPGQKSYYVDVEFEDTNSRQVQLGFDFVLPVRKVVVNPRALIFYQMGSSPTTREVIVTDYRESPLNVTGWSCNSPYVKAVVGQGSDPKRDKVRTFAVNVTVAGNIPAGRHEAILTLKTDDPQNPQLRVPLWIQGTAGPIRHVSGEDDKRKRQQ